MKLELCLDIQESYVNKFFEYCKFYGYTPEKILNTFICNFVEKQFQNEKQLEIELKKAFYLLKNKEK